MSDTKGKNYNPTVKADDGHTFSIYADGKKLIERVTKYHFVGFSRVWISSVEVRRLMEDYLFSDFLFLKGKEVIIKTVKNSIGGEKKKETFSLHGDCQYILFFNNIRSL